MKPSAIVGNPTAYWNYREIGRRSASPPRAGKSGHHFLMGGEQQ